jgi:serine-type D-Ala-D-Ala carboxypeptidase/endopeptidase (penicillin-binding protein 4)
MSPRLIRNSALLLTVAAVTIGTAGPAVAVGDPERSFTYGARGSFPNDAAESETPMTPSSRLLVSMAAANQRIASLLPTRSISSRIGSNFGVNVVDVETGETVWSRKATSAFLPASNMKVVTAVAALTAMGPDKRFVTTVHTMGRGKLVIVGGGDSTLTTGQINGVAMRAVRRINARPDLLPGMYLPSPYRPKMCVVNHKKVKSTKKHPCAVVTPGLRRKPFKVYVDDSLYANPTAPSGWGGGYEPGVVRPVRPLGFDGAYSMDSAAGVGAYLARAMKNAGLPAKYATHLRKPADAAFLTKTTSAPLSDQLHYMLQVSENNVAEMMYRNTALAMHRKATWRSAQRAALDVISSLGVPMGNLSLASGSGVSRDDRLTPEALTYLMRLIADNVAHPNLASIYYGGSLPLSGRTGTLASSNGRYTTKPTSCAAGKIRAKTGTLFDTIALSGLTTGNDGRLKAFSIMVNSRPQKYSPLETRRRVDRIAATVNGCF